MCGIAGRRTGWSDHQSGPARLRTSGSSSKGAPASIHLRRISTCSAESGFFGGIYLGFVAWSVLLLVIGVRAVHGWTWGRAAAAVALAAAFPALIVLATSL